MEKKRIWLLLVIGVIIGALAIYFVFIKKDDKNKGLNDPAIKEVKTLIKYLNSEIDGEGACEYLSFDYDWINLTSGEDIFEELQVQMYSCLHNVSLTMVDDNPYNGSMILTNEQYKDFQKYFYKELDNYDNMWKEYPLTKDDAPNYKEENDYYKTAQKYINKDYYYGYMRGDGFGSDDAKYEITDVKKQDAKTYIITIDVKAKVYDETTQAGMKDEHYQGKLKVEVVGGYLKYNPLVFSKTK